MHALPDSSSSAEWPALVVGAGSIGRRHLRNLRELGVGPLAVCDPNAERLAPITAELSIRAFADMEEALAVFQPRLALICTPPSLHVPQALRAAQSGAHLFVEKPVSHNLEGLAQLVSEVEKRGLVAQVGYNLRFHPGLIEVKRLLDSGAIGQIHWAHAEFGQYLPDWRPWQDYRQSYTARRELGGGILLDASHELDYVTWLLGTPRELICMAGKASQLEVNVEDSATVLLRFDHGVQADVHVDFLQRDYCRFCKVVGAEGTLHFDFSTSQIELRRSGAPVKTISLAGPAPDQMYRAELECFRDCVKQDRKPVVGLDLAVRTLKLVLAALESAETKRWMQLE